MQRIVDDRYAQKSRLFLLPLLQIKRDVYIKPIETYIIDPKIGVTVEDKKLIIPFEKDNSSEFDAYESSNLLNSKYLDNLSYYETDRLRVYVFTLSEFSNDFDLIIKGKYTEISRTAKSLINIYWGKIKGKTFLPHPRIQAYLNPTRETYERVAEELGLPVEMILGTELINPPDLEKETLCIDTVKLKKNSVIES